MIYGIGINDATYKTHNSKDIICPFYRTWKGMLDRSARKGTPVATEWLRFSTFKAWMEVQNWQGNELDKDLLGGAGYTPETCCFIPRHINSFMQDRRKTGSELPLGVSLNKTSGRFKAYASSDYLGTFDTPEQAHEAWRNYKWNQAQIFADELESAGFAAEVCDSLRIKYQ